MEIYRRDLKILSSQTDMTRTLRLSSLFTVLQEAAIAHTQELGAGREKTLDRGLLWIVTLQKALIRRLPVYDEEVTLLSWPGKTMHLFFPRYWQIRDRSGSILVEASSLWGLISQSTRKLVFPEEYGISLPDQSQGRDSSLPVRIKAQQAPAVQDFTVPYSYVDLNGHMNNARYFDLASDCMPDRMRTKQEGPGQMITAEYSGEAKYGETMTLHSAFLPDDCWYFSGESGGHPVFRMQFQSFTPPSQPRSPL